MIQKFMSTRDINGNRKTLVIDHEKQTFKRDYNPFSTSDYIEIRQKDRRAIIESLQAVGYKEV